MKKRIILHVAEKPSIARLIAYHLSNKNFEKIPSKSRFNPVFKFNRQFKDEEDESQMIVTSVTGHIKNFKFNDKYKIWKDIDPKDLIEKAEIEKSVENNKIAVVRNLEAQSEEIDDLVLWLDCDKEGEAICYEVLEICEEATKKDFGVHRAKFSAATRSDILKAYGNLSVPDERQKFSVEARQEIDLRIGAALTRLQTLAVQEEFKFVNPVSGVLSYGPCQFPTLGFVVKRDQAISNFQAEKLLKISLNAKKLKFKWEQKSELSNQEVKKIHTNLSKISDMEAKVILSRKEKILKNKPYPLTTVNLQKIGSSKLNMSTFHLMKVAEKLYTKGYISYPRTDTNFYDFSINTKNLVKRLENSNKFGKYVKKLLDGKFEKPRNGGRNDKAHPPIHPVKADDGDMNPDERKVYNFIASHFLAQCSHDAVFIQNKIRLEYGEEEFLHISQKLSRKNYLEIYDQKFENFSEKIFDFKEEENVEIEGVNLVKTTTRAPHRMTESELVGLMESNRIGTDATIHEHIKKIFDRGYVERSGRFIYSTKLGKSLVEAYQEMGVEIYEPELRSQMEADLDKIAEGEKSQEEVVKFYVDKLSEIYDEIENKKGTIIEKISENFGNFISKVVEDESGEEYKTISEDFDIFLCPKCSKQNSAKISIENYKVVFKCNCDLGSIYTPIKSNTFFKILEDKCKLSGTNVVRYQTRTGSTQNISPFSFNYWVKENNSQKEIIKRKQKFPCFKCKEASCQYSNKESYPVKKCGKCKDGNIIVKRRRDAGQFLSCDKFPKCKNAGSLPDGLEWILPVKGEKCGCSQNVGLFEVKIDRWDESRVVCLGCDKQLREELGYQFNF